MSFRYEIRLSGSGGQGLILMGIILAEAIGEESMLDDQGIASLSLANIAYERNDLAQAEQFAARALDVAGQRGNHMLQAQATIRQAYVHAARNDFQRAAELLKSLMAGIQNPVLLREVQAAQDPIIVAEEIIIALLFIATVSTCARLA